MVSTLHSKILILMALQSILVFILFSAGSLLMILGGNNETDQFALLEFKKQIDLDPYGALSSWNDSIKFCNWDGVTCGHRHQQRVVSLNLQGKGLGGKVSPFIGNLSFLRFLNIANNSFDGEIPQEVGHLIRLQYIVLTNNSLKGELPLSLANCTHLKEIWLSRNNFVGMIPSELFTSLSKLEIISINYNGLIGTIPASFGNMSSIRVISLGYNGLQGSIPESLNQLTNLYFLALLENNLTGTFPPSIYNLSSLETISFVQNQLHGSLPQDIGLSLPNLIVLDMGLNLFSGSIPNSISNISTLETIDLGDCSFFGPIPNNLGDLQNLQFLTIAGNQCGTREAGDLEILNSLVNSTHLNRLELQSNDFRGPIPNIRANLSSQLSILRLGRNKIFGTIPVGMENLFYLIGLDMEENFLEGNIPSTIGKLSNLQRLHLGGNRFSGQIPSSIGNLTHVYDLQLDFNSLNGNIPSSIGNCQQLQYLTLHVNNLQGPIPIQLFLISSLSIGLDLSYNSLVGSLPSEIGNMKSLSAMTISNNNMSKEIPSTIGDCNSLEYLGMENNFFEGTIPQSLTLLKGLRELDLSNNNLTGPIPNDIAKLLVLQSLNLSFNNLEGEVPTKGIFGNASAIAVYGNDKLCGGITELHLSACKNHGYTNKKRSNLSRVVLEIAGVVLGIILISSFLTLYWIRRSKSKPTSAPSSGNQFLNISYKELFQATGGFSSTNFIGFGGFGSVYKGIINQGETTVAIKVLNLQNSKSYRSFTAECKALRNIRHRNLVRILSCCSSLDPKGKDFKALVYEFMANGSLDEWLHPPVEAHYRSRNLNILERLNIAIDVAFALDYLHYHSYITIVHCDLKPSNILFDHDMVAHVSDFGLAKLLLDPKDNSSQDQTSTIGLKGSIGYAAPEYGMGGRATTSGDVYSYGILLLEMFTGKRPTDQMFTGDLNLHDFAKAALLGCMMQILDPTLLGRGEHREEIEEGVVNEIEGPSHMTDKLHHCVSSIIEIALQCSMESPKERMQMNDVVKELQVIKNIFHEA